MMELATNAKTGKALLALTQAAQGLEKRDIFCHIQDYLTNAAMRTRVCILYGLRRTGKTTMLWQAVLGLPKQEQEKAVYIKLSGADNIYRLSRDLDQLWEAGYRYVFLDEVTLMADFIDTAAFLSDVYAPMGMKLVLSGTDSLGFFLAKNYELYDRTSFIHTTIIPFREHSRLLHTDSIDEYIRYGGTLRAGELDFANVRLLDGSLSFLDEESTRQYIDTAISRNIQNSLKHFQHGSRFGLLQDLYRAGELTSAINRVVEDMNHAFVREVFEDPFVSHDLGITMKNLRRERNPLKRMDLESILHVKDVENRLMEILDIKNEPKQHVSSSCIAQLQDYLRVLDLTVSVPVCYGSADYQRKDRVLFTQPGMRYCQAQTLVYALMQDAEFRRLDAETLRHVTERLLQEVRGRMLEDIVLLETRMALPENEYDVFKFVLTGGEYDMVVHDKKNNCCAAYEIKHSSRAVREQGKHLLDEAKLACLTPHFGRLAGRFVLYRGEDLDTDDSIAYRNVEAFLQALPDFCLDSGLEQQMQKPAAEPERE